MCKRPNSEVVLADRIEPSILLVRGQRVLLDADPSMQPQIATASKRNVRYLPYAFTEHGVIMAASVLNTPRAIEVSRLMEPPPPPPRRQIGFHTAEEGKP
jgi:hypothetical protein